LPPQRPGNWGELLPSIPEGSNYLWHTRKGNGRSLFGYRTRFWSFLLKLSKREPAWTISAHPGPYTGPFHWKSRPLTTTEILRLQSFPASWKVCGSRLEQVKQVGNATPPLLAELVARKVMTALHGKKYRSKPTLAVPRARAKVPRAEIPKKFERHVKRRADHPGTGLGPNPIPTEDQAPKQRKAA
jgi:DNA (cytosine-5)-methyltransferase 1